MIIAGRGEKVEKLSQQKTLIAFFENQQVLSY
jgi:hypothetical protein